MGIEHKVESWDGKSAADIRAIYDAHSADIHFADTLIVLAFTDACEKGATWLLKAWLEAGHALNPDQISTVYASLHQLSHWEAKLHVLQCLPFLSINDAQKASVYDFLRLTLTDHNKFVRAWSYNGFYELSRQHSEYLHETRQYFDMAMRDEAPSVKARIRNIVKKGF
ncbi:hypothetical protein [Saccharospirillum alexandrii]|uniref:hypothetical protein n=1 Tax=Saccharospirillum alexandrii TaxID=2448477 RepID=UPI000FDB5698|nr:hypothetical protein [Saccharospirillum alexandrii]